MECSICCETFNKSNRLKVDCKGCDGMEVGWACRTCCQTYITTNQKEASCMFCKSTWDRDFCNNNLTKKWVGNEYKIHLENILVEQQISLLPSTQPYALARKRQTELYRQIDLAKEEIARLKNLLREQQDTVLAYQIEIRRINIGTSTNTENTEASFSHKCPLEDCNGFLNSKFVCGTCEKRICKDCMEEKKSNHVCNEELKMTVNAIMKQSKPCPGCGETISKIDGCDQMWCVKCQKQFSWRTGAILNGHNHNPEYFRYLRETGQSIAPTPGGRTERICGVEITDRTIYDIIVQTFPEAILNQSTGSTSSPIILLFTGMYRLYRHIQWDIQRNDRFAENRNEIDLKNARVDFLLNRTVKDEWKRIIQQLDKKRSKDNAYINIWRLAETVFASFIERIVAASNAASPRLEYIKIAEEIMVFKQYINTQFLNSRKIYGSTSCPGISHNWRDAGNYKAYLNVQKDEDDKIRNAGGNLPRYYTDEWYIQCFRTDWKKLLNPPHIY